MEQRSWPSALTDIPMILPGDRGEGGGGGERRKVKDEEQESRIMLIIEAQ